MDFALDPSVVVLLVVAEALYVRAVRVLRRRGFEVPAGQQVAWHVGWALQAGALVGPLDALADELVSAHMAQHLLLADIAVPFLLVGLRTPVLVFMLPRSLLVPLAHRHALRAVFRALRRPLVALPVFMLVLYGWHLSFAFEGALRHPALHALQHVSFVAAGGLVWWSALDPKRRRLRGELWKIGYIFAARMISMFLGMGLLFMRAPAYGGFYGDAARAHGLSPLGDQQLAGGMMMTLDILIMVWALIFFFWRASLDADLEERAERAGLAAAGPAT